MEEYIEIAKLKNNLVVLYTDNGTYLRNKITDNYDVAMILWEMAGGHISYRGFTSCKVLNKKFLKNVLNYVRVLDGSNILERAMSRIFDSNIDIVLGLVRTFLASRYDYLTEESKETLESITRVLVQMEQGTTDMKLSFSPQSPKLPQDILTEKVDIVQNWYHSLNLLLQYLLTDKSNPQKNISKALSVISAIDSSGYIIYPKYLKDMSVDEIKLLLKDRFDIEKETDFLASDIGRFINK